MNLVLICTSVTQAAHEAECASLKAATHAAEEHSRDLQSQHESKMDERDGTIAELRGKIEEMQATITALEANLGEQSDTTAAPQLPFIHGNSTAACCPPAFKLPRRLLHTAYLSNRPLCLGCRGDTGVCRGCSRAGDLSGGADRWAER